jgi:hypothetical protein
MSGFPWLAWSKRRRRNEVAGTIWCCDDKSTSSGSIPESHPVRFEGICPPLLKSSHFL